MQKYIFLDFDGVLNTEHYYSQLVQTGQKTADEFGPLFSPDAIENLRMVIDATDASIVISSSWKLEGFGKMKKLWSDRRMPGKLLGVTPDEIMSMNLLEINLSNPDAFAQLAGKGNEIKRWIKDNVPANDVEYRYVIFDDIMDFLPEQRANFIEVNPHTGITAKDAEKAISILNK